MSLDPVEARFLAWPEVPTFCGLDGPASDQPISVAQILLRRSRLSFMSSRTVLRFLSTALALRPYGLTASVSNAPLACALYIAGMNFFSEMPMRLSGMPAVTISAPRSAFLIGPRAALSSFTYSLAFGPLGQ